MHRLRTIMLFVVFIMAVVGCRGGGLKAISPSPGGSDMSVKGTLQVMCQCTDERSFETRYVNRFKEKFPLVDVKLINYNHLFDEILIKRKGTWAELDEALMAFAKTEEPDVVFLQETHYEKFAGAGLLRDLESLVNRDKYDIDRIAPAVLERMIASGGNHLFGFAPTFWSDALFINKSLFEKQGVPLPEKGAAWPELLSAANQLPSSDAGKPMAGLWNEMVNNDYLFSFLVQIADTSGHPLSFEPGGSLLDDEWNNLFRKAYQAMAPGLPAAFERHTKTSMTSEEFLQSMWFTVGRAAIAVGQPYYARYIQESADKLITKPFDWEIVALPGGGIRLDHVAAIYTKSRSTDAAWQYLKYVSGPEFAKDQGEDGYLPSRMGYAQEPEGHSLDAFYNVSGQPLSETFRDKRYSELYAYGSKELDAVLQKDKTLDRAIDNIEAKRVGLMESGTR